MLSKLELNGKHGSSATATKQFRLVGLPNEGNSEYRLYFTNLPQKGYSAPGIAPLYRRGGK